MVNRRGGGSAFPVATPRDGGPQAIVDVAEGITIRDYFAAQGDAPTHAELAEAQAGIVYNGDTDQVTVNGAQAVSFGAWWAGLTQNKRARLLAEVRYQHADAMLVVRDL